MTNLDIIIYNEMMSIYSENENEYVTTTIENMFEEETEG